MATIWLYFGIYNPRNTDQKREQYLDLCKKYHLITTVGSDFHSVKDGVEIGLGINGNLKISDYTIINKIKMMKHDIDSENKKNWVTICHSVFNQFEITLNDKTLFVKVGILPYSLGFSI